MMGTAATGQKGVAEHILTAAQRGEIALPPLPALVTRLLQTLQDETEADLGEISELMLEDPAITAAVLRISNSAMFTGFSATSDLGSAIQRLGLHQVGSLVTSVAHKANFNPSKPGRHEVLRYLWDHALTSAIASRHIIGGRGDEAYLAGLLHDVGKLVVLKGLDDIERRSSGTRFTQEDVEELMEALHAVLGFAALRSWKITDRLCHVALHHHDSNLAADDRLLIGIQAADAIARKLSGHRDSDRSIDLRQQRAILALQMEDDDLDALVAVIEAEVAKARSLFE